MTRQLLVAAFPPNETHAFLDRYVGLSQFRPSPWRNWLVTLATLDGVAEATEPQLAEALARLASAERPFKLSLAPGRIVAKPEHERVIALSPSQGTDELALLADRVRAACTDAGAPPTGEGFVPAVTTAYNALGITTLDTWDPIVWEIDAFELVTRSSNRVMATYSTVREFVFP